MCKIAEEIFDEGLERGRKEHAKEMAFKMATRGDSVNEIADMVGYDAKTVKTWLGKQTAVNSASPSMQV